LTLFDASRRYSTLFDAVDATRRCSTLFNAINFDAFNFGAFCGDLAGRLGRQTWPADLAGRL
jgi:hypothetical protein